MKHCARTVLLLVLVAGCTSTGPKGKGPDSDDPVVQAYFAALEPMREQNWKRAERELRRFASRHPQQSGPWTNLAIVYRQLGRTEEAEQAVAKALDLNPKSSAAWNQRGILHREAGRFSEAEAAYRKAVAADDSYPLAWLNLGILYDLYFQKLDEALTYYLRYEALVGDQIDRQAAGWIADLKRRVGRE